MTAKNTFIAGQTESDMTEKGIRYCIYCGNEAIWEKCPDGYDKIYCPKCEKGKYVEPFGFSGGM